MRFSAFVDYTHQTAQNPDTKIIALMQAWIMRI
jgi:hypothetical protein